MAHAHDQLDGAFLRGAVEDLVDQRNQRGYTFQREALAAEVALLHDLLENIGANQKIEDALLVFLRRLGLHALEHPAAAFGGVEMVDFDSDGAGVDIAGLMGVLPVLFELGSGAGTEESERVEVAFEVSELAIGGEDAFALGIGTVVGGLFQRGGAGDLGFRHRSAVPRIKDAGESQKLQGERTGRPFTTGHTEEHGVGQNLSPRRALRDTG